MAKSKSKTPEAEVVETVDAADATANVAAEVTETKEKQLAKSGKRSAKAIAETEEKLAKEQRKEEAEAEDRPKNPAPITRPLLNDEAKDPREAAKLVDKDKNYDIKDAIELAIKTSTTKFDSGVELHIGLGVDPRQADNIRATLVLPEGTGNSVRVAVFAEDDDAKIALKAGADIAGNEDFLASLDKGLIEFDVLVATPAMMPKLSRYARILGPKGLMPNPKSGTVTTNVELAIKEAKAGKLEYRVDSQGIVHVNIGKVGFGADRLQTNADAFITSLRANKPNSLKGNFIRSAYMATSMGPSIKLNLV